MRRAFTGMVKQLSHFPQNETSKMKLAKNQLGGMERGKDGNGDEDIEEEQRRQFLSHYINLLAP